MGYLSPTLAVRDMKKTIEFYTKSLGFELGMTFPTPENPEYADLRKDGMVIMFIPAANLGIGSEEELGVGVNLYLQIDGDINRYYDELKKRGVEIAVAIKDEPFGIRDFSVEDVDGYRLTFNQPLGGQDNSECECCGITTTICMSCGMPMTKLEDFAGGNPDSTYCVHCARPDGSLKSYEEALNGMVDFMMQSLSMDRETAESAAREYMAKMPAWSGGTQG
jgi:uncharacterized glyoxalase superfamily protein PhnB